MVTLDFLSILNKILLMGLFCRKKRGRIIMLEIVIWDVQHGSAAYVITPNGKKFIIDLGTGDISGSSSEFSPLQFLKSQGINYIDEIIITHPHTDHIDDILNIGSIKFSKLLRPNHLTEQEIRSANKAGDKLKVDKYIEFTNSFTEAVSDTDNVRLPKNNGGVKIEYFSPWKCSHSNINNHSIVVIIEYLGVKIVVPGDNESASWDELLELKEFKEKVLGTHVFIAPHHGRESGYSENLFKLISPEIVIVSDGKYSDTSITSKYTEVANGLIVHSRSGKPSKKRYCLTTRQDGTIRIEVYAQKGQPHLDIYRE
jgi:competence protein ComEC